MMTTMKMILALAVSALLVLGCEDKKEEGGDEATAPAGKADAGSAAAKAGEADAEEKVEAAPEEPEGPVFTSGDKSAPIIAFDLGEAGLPGHTIMVPEGTMAMEKSPSGYKLVQGSVNYSLTVKEGTFDKAQTLKIYKMLDEEGAIADESETHIIFQRTGDQGFIFTTSVKVGDTELTCSTVGGIAPYTREQVDQMIESCRSIVAAAGGEGEEGEGEEGEGEEGEGEEGEGEEDEEGAE